MPAVESLNFWIPVAGILAAVIVGNIGLIFGTFVSMRVAIAELKVKVDANSKDIDGLGTLFRNTKQEK